MMQSIQAAVQRSARRVAKTKTFPAPTRGWIRNENLLSPGVAGASLLDNWIPLEKAVRMRAGRTKYATIGSGAQCTAIMSWASGGTEKLFGASSSGIYDITTVADPNASPSVAQAMTADTYSWTQFTNAAGSWLIVANGVDDVVRYNGTSWTGTSGITGVSGADLSAVWSFKARLWFAQKSTLDAWYLGLDAITGAATKLPLGGIFRDGGSLLFGTSISIDAGDGIDDKLVFVTDRGEVAVYTGTDPASIALEGIYRIGEPLGNRAFMRAGGDVLIATVDGVIPLSAALQTDSAVIATKALSFPIEEEWRKEVDRRSTERWQMAIWPQGQIALVAMPSAANKPKRCFVVNIRTGAWARWTNHDTECVAFYDGRMFIGSSDGTVSTVNEGITDNGESYTASFIGLFEDCRAMGAYKVANTARATFLTNYNTSAKVTVNGDYDLTLPTAPSGGSAGVGPSLWGSALWGTGTWGSDDDEQTREAIWQTVAGEGTMLAPVVQITGGVVIPVVDLLSVDVVYEVGDVLV